MKILSYNPLREYARLLMYRVPNVACGLLDMVDVITCAIFGDKIGSTALALGPWKDFAYKKNLKN